MWSVRMIFKVNRRCYFNRMNRVKAVDLNVESLFLPQLCICYIDSVEF